MYEITLCYSDHNFDIQQVGRCEMCGGTNLEGVEAYRPKRDLYDRIIMGLNQLPDFRPES